MEQLTQTASLEVVVNMGCESPSWFKCLSVKRNQDVSQKANL